MKAHNFGYVSRTRLDGAHIGGLTVMHRHHSLRNFWLARCRCGKAVAKADAELADNKQHLCPACHRKNREMAESRIKQNKKEHELQRNSPFELLQSKGRGKIQGVGQGDKPEDLDG